MSHLARGPALAGIDSKASTLRAPARIVALPESESVGGAA